MDGGQMAVSAIDPMAIKRKIKMAKKVNKSPDKQELMKEIALGKLGLQNLDDIVDYFSD